jgi:hypothetical protein
MSTFSSSRISCVSLTSFELQLLQNLMSKSIEILYWLTVTFFQPTLWSKKFKQHLELGHNEEAYSAMISNPDPSRRKDCLRQFLVVLCERKQLQALVEFPYIDMYNDVS